MKFVKLARRVVEAGVLTAEFNWINAASEKEVKQARHLLHAAGYKTAREYDPDEWLPQEEWSKE